METRFGRSRETEEFRARYNAMPQPAHLFDVPSLGCGANGEWWHEEGDLMTRIEALQHVAEHNRQTLIENDGDGREGTWAMLLELGEPLTGVTTCWEIGEGGIGHEDRRTTYPMRLVCPTAAEIRQYGQLPAVGKTGAA